METSVLPAMTKLQFYSEFAVQFGLGCCFVYVMYLLAVRNAKPGWNPSRAGRKWREKLSWAMILMAGLTSMDTLPNVYYAFMDDADTVISDTAEAVTEFALNGEDLEIDGKALLPSEVIWGEPNEYQHEVFVLMGGFFFALGWYCYLVSFKASPVGMGKKMLKALAYFLLCVVILLQPGKLHRFVWDEVSTEAYCLLMALILIAVTHHWRRLPPPLPPSVS